MTALAKPHCLLQPIPGRAGKYIFQVDIPKHLIPFGQEACPDWALETKCCSGLSESLRDFDLYEMTVSPLVLALLGLGG
ncbi:hypothetical protein Celaphus_00009593 [Cervus elaphus hippelaphus]|uniref:Uncharacterized protein n=1 Tax=Cervus elaphus hippelaphus TaxID=46360 RepID=A0A212C0N7_CEREH|nr:hypothetical protein Celaphus_00009593 [Cervus elaphus hippelaphus]